MQGNKEKNNTKKSNTKSSDVSKSNTSNNKGSAEKEANNLMKEVFRNETQDIRAAFEAYFKRKT